MEIGISVCWYLVAAFSLSPPRGEQGLGFQCRDRKMQCSHIQAEGLGRIANAEINQTDANESEKAGHKRMIRQSRSATTGSRLQYYTPILR